MILITGNNIAALYLSAYFEMKKIEYRRFYTNEITDYTFYFNDSADGMQKKAMDLIGYRQEYRQNRFFTIRSDQRDYQIGMELESLTDRLGELHEEEKGNLKQWNEIVDAIGREWRQVTDHHFQMKVDMKSQMARNFRMGYQEFVKSHSNDAELQNLLLSLVPRRDISLNTAAGYIRNQIFDPGFRENRIKEFTEFLRQRQKEENQIKIGAFEELKINREEKTVLYNGTEIPYDRLILAADTCESNVRLATYYVDCENKTHDSYTFLALDDMEEAGMNQIILWRDQQGDRLDVYYENTSADEEKITEYLAEKLPYLRIQKAVTYDELKRQYGCGNFAGWAFSCMENMKNPMDCRKKDVIDITKWGNAHFTSSLLAIELCNQAGMPGKE